jgi:hypothetical protein
MGRFIIPNVLDNKPLSIIQSLRLKKSHFTNLDNFSQELCKTVPKNQNCHSERSEESRIFLFKSKNQKRCPSD